MGDPSASIKERYYRVGVSYAITLNPPDEYQFFGNPDRLKRFRSFVYEQFLAFPADWRLWIEVSEPRGMHTCKKNGPRLHCHGWIRFQTNAQIGHFLLHSFYALLRWTAVDIDTIADMTHWVAYCEKQRLFKKNLLVPFKDSDAGKTPS